MEQTDLCLDTCRPLFFACKRDNRCIESFKKCDGLQQCADNSDETAFASCCKFFELRNQVLTQSNFKHGIFW